MYFSWAGHDILLLFFLISAIVTWFNRSELKSLRLEIKSLRKKLEELAPQDKPKEQPKAEEVFMGAVIKRTPVTLEPAQEKRQGNFEETFGKWLPVWIGGLALALAGFFLVKYSIETGLLGPSVRIVLGLAFGLGLVYGADWIRNHPTIENARNISQALSGAGIADLYFCIFAASNMYDLISPTLGFMGMAAITAFAVLLSLRHGMPIALMGLVGGFVTPGLFSSEHPNAFILFAYLYLVCAGLLIVIRQSGWWGLGIPSILGAFVWVFLWIFGGHFMPNDSIWIGLFLIAISITVVTLSKDQYKEQSSGRLLDFNLTSSLNYLTLTGAIVLMGIIGNVAGLDMLQWGLFGLLSLGGIVLAYFEQRLYGFVPWIAMGVNAVMIAGWRADDTSQLTLIITSFGAAFAVSGYLLQSRSNRPLLWSGLTSAASLGYYLLAYYKLRNLDYVPENVLFWGTLALTFAGFGVYILTRLMREIPQDYTNRQHVLAIYAGTASAFLSIGMGIELPRDFLSVAIAAEMFALAWINTRIDIQALRHIAALLGIVFLYLIAPQLILLLFLSIYALSGSEVFLAQNIPIVTWPWFQLGLPALCFLGSSILLRQKKDDKTVQAMELTTIALLTIMGYYVLRHLFQSDDNTLFHHVSFIEAGAITNVLYLFSLGCFWVGHTYQRQIVSRCALVLSSVAIFRICYFDMLIANPMITGANVGQLPLFNGLLLVYGLPLAWTWLANKSAKELGFTNWSNFAQAFMLVLGFAFITINVRQFFHGDILNSGLLGNGEIYAYSLAWIFFGLALLILGTYLKAKLIRATSLAIMILSVGKVFLYDARELEGLLRVFSFLGLGFSLIGLSWFYSKFVFKDKD